MRVSVTGYIYHKEAETFDDCFDRYAYNLDNHKFCISDGVSKSFFPGLWAELLVDTFVNSKGKIDLVDNFLFRSIQKKWNDAVFEIANRPNQKYYVRNLYAQRKSAAATFVGVDFYQENGKLFWEAFALGDSFLIFVPNYVRDVDLQFQELLILSSKKDFEFDNFPDFFDSIHTLNKGKIKQTKHLVKPGKFYLMTDALSEWFINEKQNAIKEIKEWKDQQGFENRINFLRKNGLQNDDSAIMIIDIQEDGNPYISYDKILISDLKKLQSSQGNGASLIFEKEIIEIEKKFLNPPNGIGQKHTSEDSVPKKPNNISDFERKINVKKGKKQKGFWEKNLSVVKGFFSSHATEEIKSNDSDKVVGKILSENPKKKPDTPSDNVGSITDKF